MDRTALAHRPATTVPRPSATPPSPTGGGSSAARRSSPLPFRRVVQGVLVGAVTMLAVAGIDTFAGATVPVLGTFAALPTVGSGPPAVVEVPPPPSRPGTCLTWTRPDAADATVVSCARPHLFEQAGSVELTDQAVLPADGQWHQLVDQRCDPLVTAYLSGRFDPDGRYRVGALKPSPAKWAEGDRELRCGLQSASQSGALYPMTGTVAGSDQSAVETPGTCLGINSKQISDPVACTGAHAVETVGIVDLSTRFTGGFPAVTDQDAFLQPACATVAAAYAGGATVISDKKLTLYWDDLTPASWTAGSHRVNCNLGALLPDRSGFAPVTGSVKGSVTIGDQPAPPATATPAPGVPATSPAPSAGGPSADPTTGTASAPPLPVSGAPTARQPPAEPRPPSVPAVVPVVPVVPAAPAAPAVPTVSTPRA